MVAELTRDALDRARTFVNTWARPLEQARLAHIVDGGPVDAVTARLAEFRVGPGGFGHALESDARTPQASVLATLTALDVLRTHEVPADDPLVGHACTWLIDNVQTDAEGRLVWPFLPPSAQDAPHAPWWDQSQPGQLATTFRGFVANPGLAVTAHLFRHAAAAPGAVPPELLATLADQARSVARVGLEAGEVNAHDAAAHLVDEPAVPAEVRREVADHLAAILPGRVMSTPEDFGTYGIHPLWIAPHPGHPLAGVIAQQVDLALTLLIGSQSADGSWEPFWDWAGWHPDVWPIARREWQGSLVVRNLHALKAWGRC